MTTTDSFYQPTGVLAMDIIGAAYTHAHKRGRTIRKFILRKKLYGHLMEYVATQMDKNGAEYRGEELDFNGVPIAYSMLQTDPLVVEYEEEEEIITTNIA